MAAKDQFPESVAEDSTVCDTFRAFGGWSRSAWCPISIAKDVKSIEHCFNEVITDSPFGFCCSRAGLEDAVKAVSRDNFCLPGWWIDLAAAAPVTKFHALRRRVIFWPDPPILLFVQLPRDALGIRRANQVRRKARASKMLACVLDVGDQAINLLFWHKEEKKITANVLNAQPNMPLRMLQPEPIRKQRKPASRPNSTSDFDAISEYNTRPQSEFYPNQIEVDSIRAERDLALAKHDAVLAENNAILEEIFRLKTELKRIRKNQTSTSAMAQLGLDDARLKALLFLLHPDKHGNSEAATEAAKWVNGLRDELKRSRLSEG
ncbi:hypothetical protein [Siccirubricoccus sp. G192]|uniref:hypothetical protein n=1 Tax=Siccirubricoccus sp. G192 TaxID=2849651 RepID=UPI001C2C31AA|nr:hypothetical protein [Siccirubricoccus sp. G192]MBV1797943.1 hypothetical protein [Siccirubricoccus sp. G192]